MLNPKGPAAQKIGFIDTKHYIYIMIFEAESPIIWIPGHSQEGVYCRSLQEL